MIILPVKTLEELSSYLDNIKFKRKILGGVDEDDVWKVIGRLQKEYRSILDAAEQRQTALLEERNHILLSQQAEIARLKAALAANQHFDTGGDTDGQRRAPQSRTE